MRDERARSTEDSLEIHRPVQAFDAASAAKRLRQEKTYEDHGRSVLSLFHGPSLRAMLTAIAAGSRTGERRVAGDRKSTRLNSSHANISYAVFCLKKKKITLKDLLYVK